MSLLAALNLVAPKTVLGAAPAPTADAHGGGARKAAQPPKGSAGDYAKTGLGTAELDAKRKARLLALVDPDGYTVMDGSAKGWSLLYHANRAGSDTIKAISQLAPLLRVWGHEVGATRQAAARGDAELKKLEPALAQMRAQMARARPGDPLYDSVHGFLKERSAAEALVADYTKASAGYEKAWSAFDAATLAVRENDAKQIVAQHANELKDLEEEIADVKATIETVIDIADEIRKADWEALATRAIKYVSGKVVDAFYEPQLEELRAKLDEAKQALTALTKAKLFADVETARYGVMEAAAALTAVNVRMRGALEALGRARTHATDVLVQPQSKAAFVGVVIRRASEQIGLVTSGLKSCDRLDVDVVECKRQIDAAIRRYGEHTRALADLAATGDARLMRDAPWAKGIAVVATRNAVELGRLQDWMKDLAAESQKARRWLGTAGPTGPMGRYDQAISGINNAMTDG